MATNYDASPQIIVSKTIKEALIGNDCDYKYADDHNTVTLIFTDGSKATFYHSFNCCEKVKITVWEDLEKLNGIHVNSFNQVVIRDPYPEKYESSSITKLVFNNEFVIEWLGTSNGCYDEGVDFKYDSAPTLVTKLLDIIKKP